MAAIFFKPDSKHFYAIIKTKMTIMRYDDLYDKKKQYTKTSENYKKQLTDKLNSVIYMTI